ncbi:MAG TPA: DUF87 domain-containing protein [Candidatus Saccharibacteria bacterium]|nr:DUF87 domain-containing protein [Candidatus Saccharibacteria bacterium]
MKEYFELYLTSDRLTAENWQKLYSALVAYLGPLGRFEVIFWCHDNIVRYFVASKKDLSSLSNSLEGMIIRPVDSSIVELPHATSKEKFLRFVTGGNLLDLKEKLAVKRGKDLEYAVFNIQIINVEKAYVRSQLLFKGPGEQWTKGSSTLLFFPKALLAVDFAANTRYLKKTTPKYLNIEKSLHMMSSQNIDALFEVDTFPYMSSNYYLGLTDYEFDKHSLIIGASGSGKSKLITLIIDRLSQTQLKMNYRIVVVDPHASLLNDLSHIENTQVVAFDKNDSTDLFPGVSADLTSATELTATLFKSILGDEQVTPRLDKLLRFSLFTLMTAQAMSLENLRRFLGEVEYRTKILEHVSGYIPQNIAKFFGADFNELRTQYYNETVLPLVSLVDEMQLQPSLVNEGDVSLASTIQDNFLTVFSLNKVSMGERVVKTVAGLIIQQVFLLAQARAFGQKVILIIDEVSVVQNPTLAQILAEARKFNLTVILTQQYFGQVDKNLRDAIFANVFNYYAFKVSEEDARSLEGNLNMELPKEIIEEGQEKGVNESELKVKLMTELHPRECLVRVMSNG